MAMLIDQIDSSGLFAQSAYSASIATNDSNGNVITATYLTAHQDISNKLDTTAFSTVSSDFYPYSNPSGFITGVDLTPYQTTAGMTAYQPVGSYATTNDLEQVSGDITALIPSTAGLASEAYVQTNSAEITAMIPTDYYPDTNPSGFITGVDLTPYQTTAGMSDYQTTANMTAYEPKINYGYSAGAVSSINGSAILGETIPYEVYGISAGDNITIWEDNNALWISAASTDLSNYYTKTDTSSKQELSDAIGNVETLLASL